MKTIELKDAKQMKANDIIRYNQDRRYIGNAAADQRIQYINSLSDEEYVEMHNEVARKENIKAEAKKTRKAAISEERKATGMSKKQYRAEYDRLNALYKAGDYSVKEEMKRIQKYAF